MYTEIMPAVINAVYMCVYAASVPFVGIAYHNVMRIVCVWVCVILFVRRIVVEKCVSRSSCWCLKFTSRWKRGKAKGKRPELYGDVLKIIKAYSKLGA